MKLFSLGKDGGQESTVWGFWFIELKSFFSVAFLLFKGKSREAFHSHAFHAISWVIKGKLTETLLDGSIVEYTPSLKPIYTSRHRFHKVDSDGNTLVFTFRGRWAQTWMEYREGSKEVVTLTHGRKEL